MTKEEIQDFTLRVTHANKTSMIVIIYDILLTYLRDARKALQRGDNREFRTEIGRARNSLNELIASVNTSDELGLTLLRLYIFSSGELTKAFINYDERNIENVIRIMNKLTDAYRTIADKDESQPVMGNPEKVFSGLTYNPYGKVESMVEPSTSRGILA